MSTPSITKFLSRVQSTQRSRGKNVILTIEEAQEIAVELAQVLLKQNDVLSELSQARKEAAGPVEIHMGGGSFK
jgi:hypothetical protein